MLNSRNLNFLPKLVDLLQISDLILWIDQSHGNISGHTAVTVDVCGRTVGSHCDAARLAKVRVPNIVVENKALKENWTFINDVTQMYPLLNPLPSLYHTICVVYLDQQIGAAHLNCWFKCIFCKFLTLFASFWFDFICLILIWLYLPHFDMK